MWSQVCLSARDSSPTLSRRSILRARKGVPFKVHVSSRVIVDAASFKEANPNYSIPKIQESSDNVYEFALFICGNPSSTTSQSTVERTLSAQVIQHEDLLICSPTVLGYSLQDKQWRADIQLPFRNAVVSDIDYSRVCGGGAEKQRMGFNAIGAP